ncbi:MAG: hypothetical protein ABIB11_01405, partial [Candidatus Omnitrophota bacterium]
MRIICLTVLMFFTGTSILYAEEGQRPVRTLIKLIYSDGFLINTGEEDLLKVEVVKPFYSFIGDIPKDKMVNISDIKTKFTVQFTVRQ